MTLKSFWEEYCPKCGKKQTGRTEPNDRIWWTPCPCRNIVGCPVDYPRLVSIKSISKVFKRFEDLPPDFQSLCLLDLPKATEATEDQAHLDNIAQKARK